jgi:hypothetical protein
MTNDPIIEFPVIASLRQGRRQFITTWSLKTVLLCLSSIADHAAQRAGLRISNNAASKIAWEWTEAGECPSVKPIALAFRSDARFVPLLSAPHTGIGMLSLPLGAILDVLDGIQRVAALQKATISNQNLSQSTWPIHLIEVADEHDLAILTASWEKTRLATVRIQTKPRSQITDHSPWIAQVITGSVFLKYAVATGKSSLAPRSPRLWTGTAVRNAFNMILDESKIKPTANAAQSFSESWDCLANAVPDLSHYLGKTTTARELRANTILASASIIPALAEITLAICNTPPHQRQNLLSKLATVNWSRDAGAWPEIVPRVMQKEAWTRKLQEHCDLPAPKPLNASPLR